MATFLLSVSAHVVFSHAPLLRTVTQLKAESSLPIRLTQRGPLVALTRPRRLLSEGPRSRLFEVWELGHIRRPLSTNHCLYLSELGRHCYPERNFERNQLLGSSMSLSPLYVTLTKDLHVTTATGLHQPFDWLRPRHAKITTFRVYIRRLCTRCSVNRATLTWLNISAFAAPLCLHTLVRSLT